MEALPSCQPLFVLTRVPCVHGLHDLSVFPHGFLAVDHYLQQYSDLSSGKSVSPALTVQPCINCDPVTYINYININVIYKIFFFNPVSEAKELLGMG